MRASVATHANDRFPQTAKSDNSISIMLLLSGLFFFLPRSPKIVNGNWVHIVFSHQFPMEVPSPTGPHQWIISVSVYFYTNGQLPSSHRAPWCLHLPPFIFPENNIAGAKNSIPYRSHTSSPVQNTIHNGKQGIAIRDRTAAPLRPVEVQHRPCGH